MTSSAIESSGTYSTAPVSWRGAAVRGHDGLRVGGDRLHLRVGPDADRDVGLRLAVPGELVVRKGGKDVFVATGGGLVEVTGRRVSVLTDMAVAADKIDEAKAEEARRRAEARLREKLSAEEVAATNASLARSLAQLKVRRRHRG